MGELDEEMPAGIVPSLPFLATPAAVGAKPPPDQVLLCPTSWRPAAESSLPCCWKFNEQFNTSVEKGTPFSVNAFLAKHASYSRRQRFVAQPALVVWLCLLH